MTAEFGLLGEVTARVAGRRVDIGAARQRCVLAALLVEVNVVVAVDRLVDRVWGAEPPRRARETLASYVSRLRRALLDADGVAIVRRSGGYVLVTDAAPEVDLLLFRELRARADRDQDQAASLLADALDLWQGEPLAGLHGEWAEAERDRLGRERSAAQHDLVDARIRLGQGARLVVELGARAAEHPLDERLAGQYMRALCQAGRTADALDHYRRVRACLVDELGADPGAALQEVHQVVLTEGPAPAVGTAVPRELPAEPALFVGRDAELNDLDTALAAAATGGPVVISAVAGAGGIGKTWLALHWAHRHVDRFPDGQLFVDLRGFGLDTTPVDPAAALHGFLDALGVAAGQVPADLGARSALFRSLVADRRMLVVLDNAAGAEQVAPLLPGGRSCAVLVTSRRILTGLVARHGARHLDLDVLADDEARALLEHRLGAARVTAEPEAVTTLLDWCRGFPLALGILAGRAHTHPGLPLAHLAAEVVEHGVTALDDDDPTASLPAVLATSHRALTVEQRHVFGLLGAAPGPDIGLPAAASLTGLPSAHTARVLRALQEASLLHRDPHGRYAMHDLVRDYAATTALDLPADLRTPAGRRVVDYYLHTADTAVHLLNPHASSIGLDPPAPGVHPCPLPDVTAALAWLSADHACLMAVQQAAAGQRRHHDVVRLARLLTTIHQRHGRRHDDLAVWRAAADAADHLDDLALRVRAHRYLGRAHVALDQHDEAVGLLHRALALAEHDPVHRAHTHFDLAWACERQGDDRRALEHARQALTLYRTFDDPVWVATGLNLVGWHAARVGEYDTARAHCEEGLALHRANDYPTGEAVTLDSLGVIDHSTGHHRQAVHRHQESLALFRALGHTVDVTSVLDHLGHPLAALGEREQARAAWHEALELYRRLGLDADADRVRTQLDSLG